MVDEAVVFSGAHFIQIYMTLAGNSRLFLAPFEVATQATVAQMKIASSGGGQEAEGRPLGGLQRTGFIKESFGDQRVKSAEAIGK